MGSSIPDLTVGQRFGLAISAAAVAETATYPLDFLKTRLQLQGEYVRQHTSVSAKPKKLGMASIAINEIKKDGGLLKLYKGISPALLRHIVYTGVRMPLYETLRDHLRPNYTAKEATSGNPIKSKIPPGMPLGQAMFIAGFSGGLAQFLASPTDLLKVRMQSGEAKTLGQAIRQLPNLQSWWRGATPNVYRAICVNQGDLMTYDRVKSYMLRNEYMEEGPLLHFTASACAGFIACCFATPADTIKTRMMNQGATADGKGKYYNGVAHCAKLIIQKEGFMAFYRGFFAAWPRMALWSQFFWHSNETIRNMMGLKPF